MSNVARFYIQKKSNMDSASRALTAEISAVFNLSGIDIHQFVCYDIENLSAEYFDSVYTMLTCATTEVLFKNELPLFENHRILHVQALPGQFVMRDEMTEQAIQILVGGERPIVRTSTVYAIANIGDSDFAKVRSWLINPIESREITSVVPTSLVDKLGDIADVAIIEDFAAQDFDALRNEHGLSMSDDDMSVVREYFTTQKRNPTITELRVIDTYWSDHCRHSTFLTELRDIKISDNRAAKAYQMFLEINGTRPVTLMNIAVAAMRHMRDSGRLPMLDVSEENNACTIKIKANIGGEVQDWLLYFKNETHNHPTEMEPYGGAGTCVGGGIRDPLSGRCYVYQGMRISGSADPRAAVETTLDSKLPTRKITTTAARGNSDYGNQIGLAAGLGREIYHPGYVAKRMECGALIGATPASNVVRATPAPGDYVLLLGGKTGRDGVGGASGSSRTVNAENVSNFAAEVQKGDPALERYIQRLFINPEATVLIKKCNDFGAGGVSVAIGELADGVSVNLDNVPVKYPGLNGTELAISESQERMAVVVAPENIEKFMMLCNSENVAATHVATVTAERKLIMKWRGKTIVDFDRDFLDSSGAARYSSAVIPAHSAVVSKTATSLSERLIALCADLNFAGQRGIIERFDGTVGGNSILMPYGGSTGLSEAEVMAALLPANGANTASVMSYGFNVNATETDPFGGSAYAVLSSVAKLIASGVPHNTIHLSLQEYFPRLKDDPVRWGVPLAALLGAFSAQIGLNVAAIGGKDSMSGSFGEIDVPPTLISFAAGVTEADDVVLPHFVRTDSNVYLLETPLGEDGLPNYPALLDLWSKYSALITEGKVLSARTTDIGGVWGAILKMSLGENIGVIAESTDLNESKWASIIFETAETLADFIFIGKTTAKPILAAGNESVEIATLAKAWEAPLAEVFPTRIEQSGSVKTITSQNVHSLSAKRKAAKPRAVIPIIPGATGELDVIRAIENAGGSAHPILIHNLTPSKLSESIAEFSKALRDAQMLILPGGQMGGEDLDTGGKMMYALLQNPSVNNAVKELLADDGLFLGLGTSSLQAMLWSNDQVALTRNSIARHQAKFANVRVSSTLSPWLSKCQPGEVYTLPISTIDGRFTAPNLLLEELNAAELEVAMQYCTPNGEASMDIAVNPVGSMGAIAAITSTCGRILGMAVHPERCENEIAINTPGRKKMSVFASGVEYFK